MVIVGAVAVVAIAGVVAAFVWNNSGAPKPVTLSDSNGSGSGSTGLSDSGSGSGSSASSLTGTWKIQTGRTFAGYRVREKLAELPAPSDAVGRTPAVTGTMAVTGTTISAVTISADLSQLKSDRDRRDNAIRMRGLETANFPTATFKLTSPIKLGAVATGKVVSTTATGNLTLHGVTKPVQVPLQGKFSGSTIEVVGNIPIQFADFQIQPPNFTGFVTVQDHGTMELDLVFAKSA